jgi:hypothetical protein
MYYLEWLYEYNVDRFVEMEDGVPSMVLIRIATSTLLVSSVGSGTTMMLRSEHCKWSFNNVSCSNETTTLAMCLYGGDKNCNIGDGGERCGWKVNKME